MRLAELADILDRELGADISKRAVEAICREAAGETLYIPQRIGQPDIQSTDTPKTVAKRYGVSRRTAYTWVKKWRR